MFSMLANAWSDAGHSVTLLSFGQDVPKTFDLSPAIHERLLRLPGGASWKSMAGLRPNLGRLRILRRAIREARPDVVVSFMHRANVLTILATAGLGVPVIVSDRSDPWRFKIGRSWSALRAITYPFASAVVCQTERVAEKLRQSTRQNTVVIPNPVPLRARTRPSGNQVQGKRIFAMGRLDPVKGFDLLLHAFCSVAEQHPGWSLTILGEGDERGNLESLVVSLGLSARVFLPGWALDPFSQFAEAELFVLSSRVEGFPNALCEAMSCGVPVIAFDCESGPAEIVRHDVDGVLVPPQDVHALASAMHRLINDADERARFRLRAPEVVDRFSVVAILQRWSALFRQVTPVDRRSTFATAAGSE
jgi:glycosyltransferase involved in cell wall biosynthesis